MSQSTDPSPIVRIEAQVDRVREELRRLVRTSATNQRQIERDAGWSRGYLSQVLQGHISLTVQHVLTVLHALDTSPDRFFVDLYGSQPAPLDEIRQKLAVYDAAFEELRARGLLSADEARGAGTLDTDALDSGVADRGAGDDPGSRR